ncbi:unnamed protein product (macronuclear) [Paramecium tetraurelia]|uniref:Intimal thickness related receptor IRP domain-containing protein n=1 Tax=Paramecium tetraurelia TaxID=5888 RepID=A0E2A5_PARTE|nr:uncharacterized protein GSPATT00022594001 [Paramecium tetraurelia]CAK89422.1 unnamed protein product [Paramecium tetraurelia]|eukprot:XP_001456819.1 hypothetical protein (macronuclear) [Paramecium tetraurelia strain d4-2]
MFVLFIIYQCYAQFNILTTIGGKNISIYENEVQNHQFSVHEQYQCHPSDLFEEDQKQGSRIFYIQNLQSKALNLSIIPISLRPRDMQLINVPNQVEQQEITIEGSSTSTYNIYYECYQNWAFVELHVRYEKTILNFRYIKICEDKLYYHDYPDLILAVIALIITYIGAIYGQKRFKLKPAQAEQQIDELESCESFYKARQIYSPQYSQPEQIIKMGEFQTTPDSAQIISRRGKETNLTLRIFLYLFFVIGLLIALFLWGEISILEIPIYGIYFVCVQIANTDLLIYIVSSSISPNIKLPLYGRVKLINLFTYLLQFVYTFFLVLTDNWVLRSFSSICLLFQLIRFMKFYNLQQLLSVYGVILGLSYVIQYQFGIEFPKLHFPNTFFLENPKLTCSGTTLLQLMLPCSLLTYTRYFRRQTRSHSILFKLGYLSYVIGVGLTLKSDGDYLLQTLIDNFLPSIMIFLTINVYGIARREMKQLYSGIEPGLHNRAIQQQYSYELTIDKYNKNQ